MTADTHPFRQLEYPTSPLHLANAWLASEYLRTTEAIEAQQAHAVVVPDVVAPQ